MELRHLDLVLSVYLALLGLLVGSYLNVVVHRLPRGLSTTLPRSRCPRCLVAIRPWDNIPVLSFLVLGRRCRSCGLKIAWRYPALEVLTAVLFVGCYVRFEGTFEIAVAVLFCCLMIVLAMIDLEHYLLPDVITLPGIVLGLVLQPWLPWVSSSDAWIGALVGAGVLYAAAWLWYLWKGVLGMGMGDVKMLAMVGAFLGWRGVVATLFLASLAGSAVGLGLMARGRFHLQSKLPFGFFLALGAIVTLFFEAELATGYERFGYELYRWVFSFFGGG